MNLFLGLEYMNRSLTNFNVCGFGERIFALFRLFSNAGLICLELWAHILESVSAIMLTANVNFLRISFL